MCTCTVVIVLLYTTLGEGSLSWEDVGSFSTSDQKFVITMNHTLVQITSNEDTVQFAILRSQLNCTKYSVCPRKHYLGFYVPGITGLTSKTHGMIGMYHKITVTFHITYYRSIPKTVHRSGWWTNGGQR